MRASLNHPVGPFCPARPHASRPGTTLRRLRACTPAEPPARTAPAAHGLPRPRPPRRAPAARSGRRAEIPGTFLPAGPRATPQPLGAPGRRSPPGLTRRTEGLHAPRSGPSPLPVRTMAAGRSHTNRCRGRPSAPAPSLRRTAPLRAGPAATPRLPPPLRPQQPPRHPGPAVPGSQRPSRRRLRTCRRARPAGRRGLRAAAGWRRGDT